MNEIARISYGYSEFELNGDYQEIEKKAKKQIRRACQVILDDLVMDWGDLEDWVIQAPERLPVIFSRGKSLDFFINENLFRLDSLNILNILD